jgi:hypothetical protein
MTATVRWREVMRRTDCCGKKCPPKAERNALEHYNKFVDKFNRYEERINHGSILDAMRIPWQRAKRKAERSTSPNCSAALLAESL